MLWTTAGRLGGIFRGLTELVDLVREMNERGETRITRRGVIGSLPRIKDLCGSYEFAVTLGDLTRPPAADSPVSEVVDFAGAAAAEPVVDVLEETGVIRLVAEMPGVTAAEIRFEVRDDVLRLESTGARRYYREVLLPAPVHREPISLTCNNGLLEMVLAIQRDGRG